MSKIHKSSIEIPSFLTKPIPKHVTFEAQELEALLESIYLQGRNNGFTIGLISALPAIIIIGMLVALLKLP